MIENKKGITLIELLIAVTLLGLVMAAAAAIDFTSRMALVRGTKKVDVSGRARYALEHMTRHIRFANNVSPTSGPAATIILWIDDNNTPGDTADDNQLTYAFSGTQILFSDADNSITNEVIADGVTACNFNINNDPSSVMISITITSGTESISLETTVSLWCKGNI